MDKVTKQEKGLSIYSVEEEKFIEVTQNQMQVAEYFHQQVLLGAFVSANAIKKIFDERLYYALGCHSQEDYIQTKLPFGRNQAYKLFAIANKFEGITKSLNNNKLIGEGSSGKLGEVPNTVLSSFSLEKLYEISKIEDDEMDKLIKKGKINLDGKEVSLDDLKDMTAKEIAHQIKKATKQYQEKLKKIETENIQLRETTKLLESEKNHLLDENKNAKEIETVYGPTANTLKHKKWQLDEARKYLNNFDSAIMKAAITEEDPQGIQKDLVDMIAKVDEVYQRLIDVYGIITTRF